jgi:hypothetical protein
MRTSYINAAQGVNKNKYGHRAQTPVASAHHGITLQQMFPFLSDLVPLISPSTAQGLYVSVRTEGAKINIPISVCQIPTMKFPLHVTGLVMISYDKPWAMVLCHYVAAQSCS